MLAESSRLRPYAAGPRFDEYFTSRDAFSYECAANLLEHVRQHSLPQTILDLRNAERVLLTAGVDYRLERPMLTHPEAFLPFDPLPRLIDQVEWENFGTENCSKIVFWIPRKLDTMPAFTTNVEFGRYVGSGKCMYGRPDDSEKNRYLDWLYKKLNSKESVHNSLESLLLESSKVPKTPEQIMDEMSDDLKEEFKLSYEERRFKRFMEVIDTVNQKEPSGPGEWIVMNDDESAERYTEHVYVQKFGSNTFLEGSFRFGEDKNWYPIDWFKSKGWNRWSPKIF